MDAATVVAMERRVHASDLVGAAELAELLGLSHAQSLHTLRKRHEAFPAPVTTLKGGAMIWLWSEVRAWAIATGRMENPDEH